MMVLHDGRAQTEKQGSRPPATRDSACDLRERAVAFPVEECSVIEHRDSVRGALPLANQNRPDADLPARRFDLRPSRGGVFADPSEQAPGRGLETAESPLLDAVGDASEQQDRPILLGGSTPYSAFQRSRSPLNPSSDRLAISARTASRLAAGLRCFMLAARR